MNAKQTELLVDVLHLETDPRADAVMTAVGAVLRLANLDLEAAQRLVARLYHHGLPAMPELAQGAGASVNGVHDAMRKPAEPSQPEPANEEESEQLSTVPARARNVDQRLADKFQQNREPGDRKRLVLAVLTDQPQRMTDIAHAAGLATENASNALQALLQSGEAVKAGYGLYRLAQGSGEVGDAERPLAPETVAVSEALTADAQTVAELAQATGQTGPRVSVACRVLVRRGIAERVEKGI